MAPEQALARHGLADHRVDVYGLGCTLYELLTGKPALRGDDKAEILRAIAFEEPTAPRKLDKHIPTELETVALKCLAKNPAERYATAGELVADLRRWLDDKPIKARRPTARQRLARWGRRHPGLTAALGLAAGLLLAGAWAWDREKTQADTAARTVAAEADRLRDADRLPEALRVARHAAALLPRFGGDATLRLGVVERVRDLAFLCRLEEIRIEQAAGVQPGKLGFDRRRAGPLYRQVFLDYGAEVLAGEEAEIVAALGGSAIKSELAAALDDWSQLAGDRAISQRLGRLAEALDPGSIAARVRRAARDRDIETLKRLAGKVAGEAPPLVLQRLAEALEQGSALTEAERLLRAGLRQHPGDFWLNQDLAFLLTSPRDSDPKPGGLAPERAADALRYFQASLALRPNSPGACLNVGCVLTRALNRPEDGVEFFQRATELKPDYASAQFNLGNTLMCLGRYQEAEAPLRMAATLEPDPDLESLELLVDLLGGRLHRPADAEVFIRRVVELKPNDPHRRHDLGVSLALLGNYREAEAAFRRAVELDPKQADSWFGLGNALSDQKRPEAAVAAYSRAVELDPSVAMTHRNLGKTLLDLGKPGDAEPVLRRAIELEPAIAAANGNLILALVRQGRNVAAAQFAVAIFAARPSLAEKLDGCRYNAACSAALAGCGQGVDTVELAPPARADLRRQAHDWLTAELLGWQKLVANPADRPALQKALRHWQKDSDLGGVRDPEALAKLPETERTCWQKLWTDVADILKRATEPKAAEKPDKKP
jgi:tetratricopeptide (TPR) repeat protein